jgi:hypothetical protein
LGLQGDREEHEEHEERGRRRGEGELRRRERKKENEEKEWNSERELKRGGVSSKNISLPFLFLRDLRG